MRAKIEEVSIMTPFECFYQKLSDGSYSELSLVADAITYRDELYRKVETELTDREAFIEVACKAVPTTAEEDIKVMGKMFDAGCRFNTNLVEGE